MATPKRKTRTYIVRTNCEHSIAIEAESADQAIAKAREIDVAEWGQAWADIEVGDTASGAEVK